MNGTCLWPLEAFVDSHPPLNRLYMRFLPLHLISFTSPWASLLMLCLGKRFADEKVKITERLLTQECIPTKSMCRRLTMSVGRSKIGRCKKIPLVSFLTGGLGLLTPRYIYALVPRISSIYWVVAWEWYNTCNREIFDFCPFSLQLFSFFYCSFPDYLTLPTPFLEHRRINLRLINKLNELLVG